MTFRHPFQKLCCVLQENGDSPLVLAATGPVICLISVQDGRLLSRWPSDDTSEVSDVDDKEESNAENGQRPAKRRKTESTEETQLSRQASEGSDDSLEIVAERKKGERRRPKVVDSKQPNFSHMLATKDAKHIVAVTAEDKSVKVFRLQSSARLKLLSERSLPKRLCAVGLTKDENVILAADKFGDVYSLPLHPSKDYIPKLASQKGNSEFAPSATELTVHTKGNREALRQQLIQKKFKARKEGPDFEHQLILGHVSLLTDLAVGEGEVAGRKRPYILTADRDEHIRVSRGIPQAHVIESYCLGNQEFVSKICIPFWASDLLIAGSGEPSLRIFKWQSGKQTCETSLLGAVSEDLKASLASEGRSPEKLAVSGIWPIDGRDGINGEFLVALEGLPILLNYSVSEEDKLCLLNCIQLKANVLDVTRMAGGRILVSLDSVHKPMSVKIFQTEDVEIVPPFQGFELSEMLTQHEKEAGKDGHDSHWKEIHLPESQNMHQLLSEVESPKTEPKSKGKGHDIIYSNLGEFLYGLENLRKKREGTGEEEAEETEEVVEAGDIVLEELNIQT